MPRPDEVDAALESIRIHRAGDPFRFQVFNRAQVRFLNALRDPKPESLTVVLFLKPNRVGGSRVAMAALSAIMNGTEHPAAQCSPFGARWPFPVRSARLVSTSETLGDTGPLQKAIRDLFPAGVYSQNRGVGKAYYSAMTLESGWDLDMMSYGQDALTAAGSTKGLIVMSEPPPRDLYVECLTRLGGNGLMIIECTQLDLAPWLEELAEDAGGRQVDGVQYGSLRLDGRAVGEVRVVRGDIEDSCREHSNGHQSHQAIEAMVAGWPEEEREARRTGKPLRLSGRIYPNWTDQNELEVLPDYHAEAWSRGEVRITSVMDEADARPWAMAWFATFPNQDVVAFAEWPRFDYQACKRSPVTDLEDYRDVIIETEAQFGRPVDARFDDPNFGGAPGKGSTRSIRTMLAGPCRGCMNAARRAITQQGGDPFNDMDESPEIVARAARDCAHRLAYSPSLVYSGSVRDGHIIVRAAIGGNGTRPKLYAMRDACQNFCRGMRRYATKVEKNPDRATLERPELVYKDFPDLARYLYLKRGEVWPVTGDAPVTLATTPAKPFKMRAEPKAPTATPRLRTAPPPTATPDRATYNPDGDGRP